jgi:hypothetical protein
MNVVDTLRRDGCAKIEPFSKQQVDDIRHHLATRIWHDGHVMVHSKRSLSLPDAFSRVDWPMFCCEMEDVVTAPHVLERAFGMYDIARDYFGEQPYLYSMNAFWTQPSPITQYKWTHFWHRDGDCKQQLVMFLFGTDVMSVSAGAHMYQRGSHNFPGSHMRPENPGPELPYPEDQPPAEVIETITGEAGTTFLADTRGLHVGIRPQFGKRLLIWARWGNDELPQSYVWDRLRPVPRALIGDRYPTDPATQKAIRLVVS